MSIFFSQKLQLMYDFAMLLLMSKWYDSACSIQFIIITVYLKAIDNWLILVSYNTNSLSSFSQRKPNTAHNNNTYFITTRTTTQTSISMFTQNKLIYLPNKFLYNWPNISPENWSSMFSFYIVFVALMNTL